MWPHCDMLPINKSSIKRFWDWFSANSVNIYHFERNQEKIFLKLQSEFKKIHPDLVFEFSPILSDGSREFVISADGIKSVFPIVFEIVKNAPTINNWKIIALRQPHKEVDQVVYKGLSVNFKNVYFKYGEDQDRVAIELNLKDYYESEEWSTITFILLDTILGEYDSEMKLSRIEKKRLIETEIPNLLPIRELPIILKNHTKAFNN